MKGKGSCGPLRRYVVALLKRKTQMTHRTLPPVCLITYREQDRSIYKKLRALFPALSLFDESFNYSFFFLFPFTSLIHSSFLLPPHIIPASLSETCLCLAPLKDTNCLPHCANAMLKCPCHTLINASKDH